MTHYTNDSLKEKAKEALAERGVALKDIASLVLSLQKDYVDDLSADTCLEHIDAVLSKREVQHTILTAIELDTLAEKNVLSEPISTIIQSDEGLYGVDEVLACSIVNVYGSIGFTNFGYLDKEKIGILKTLNDKKAGNCHTFLDDIVAAIAAAASSRLAHHLASDN
ncbi:phosphatidylglycerophosphatase A [Aliibacillus thermotolerans]|uniref:Phosphatidylglycerophosphatase A n=1 Tax=Aliibacillus thermotolerans TaxID=1834418 RepID=A0ABW0U7E0_9BACI|nr:phosphatidylglycerophosphatase A [Aliibacillus thermotolerans]MDA3129681.1 phosphatidylglycerophosphatase A [Aliibacillus thermotolerans]